MTWQICFLKYIVAIATDTGDGHIIIGDCGIVLQISDPTALADALVRIAMLADNDYEALSHPVKNRIVENYEMSHVSGLNLNHYRNLVQSSKYVQY